jgi:RNA exonuclease 4
MSDNLSEKLKANYVGLDCEMVGIGLDGKQSALARCCLVNYDGEVIYDEFVRPPGFVTDFRTKYSGVRKKDLRQGTAITLLEVGTRAHLSYENSLHVVYCCCLFVTFIHQCQTRVADLIKGKVLVGHALQNDLDVLMLSHPRTMIRDTAKYRPYMRVSAFYLGCVRFDWW